MNNTQKYVPGTDITEEALAEACGMTEYLAKGESSDVEALREPLREWLTEHKAQVMWSVDISNVGAVTCFSINHRTFHVVVYDDSGWDILLPILDPEIDVTLAKLAEACGITEEDS